MLPCDEIWKSRYRREGKLCHEPRHDLKGEAALQTETGTTTRGAPTPVGLMGDRTEIMAATLVSNADKRAISLVNAPTNVVVLLESNNHMIGKNL